MLNHFKWLMVALHGKVLPACIGMESLTAKHNCEQVTFDVGIPLLGFRQRLRSKRYPFSVLGQHCAEIST